MHTMLWTLSSPKNAFFISVSFVLFSPPTFSILKKSLHSWSSDSLCFLPLCCLSRNSFFLFSIFALFLVVSEKNLLRFSLFFFPSSCRVFSIFLFLFFCSFFSLLPLVFCSSLSPTLLSIVRIFSLAVKNNLL